MARTIIIVDPKPILSRPNRRLLPTVFAHELLSLLLIIVIDANVILPSFVEANAKVNTGAEDNEDYHEDDDDDGNFCIRLLLLLLLFLLLDFVEADLVDGVDGAHADLEVAVLFFEVAGVVY